MRVRLRVIIVLLAMAIVVPAAYWQVQGNQFVFDSNWYIVRNSNVRTGLTFQNIKWAFESFYQANWHPLTWISHFLDVELFGIDPKGHHLVSILLHTINTILLFLVLRGMTGTLWRSALVAALFGIHPLHVESVAWVAERKDVLSAFFWFLTMGAYLRYVRSPGLKRYLLVVISFTLGLMAKPMLVTLPFALLLLDYWPLKRLGWRKNEHADFVKIVFLEKIPLLTLSTGSAIITYYAQKSWGATVSSESLPFGLRLSNAIWSYVRYMGKMIWPTGLSVYYPHPRYKLTFWLVAASFLLLAVITILALRRIRHHPYAAVGWFWYLGTLVPVIGLVQVGDQAMADRYTYIPLIGLFIAISWGINELVPGWRNRGPVLAFLAFCVLFSSTILTGLQVRYWRNNMVLFTHADRVTSDNWLAQHNLGIALQERGRVDDAIALYMKAIEIKPKFPEAHNSLGLALAEKGMIDLAIEHYRKALESRPDFAEAHNNLGISLAEKGLVRDAVYHYQRALSINPDNAMAHNNLGRLLARYGASDEAIYHYREALRLKPDFSKAHNNLALLLMTLGKAEEARFHFREALKK